MMKEAALLLLLSSLVAAQAPDPAGKPSVRYDISVSLNPDTKTVEGYETLVWCNRTPDSTDHLMLHLYLNAFKNNLSTWVLEQGWKELWPSEPPFPEDYWGYTEIETIDLFSGDKIIRDGIKGFYFSQTDDANENDHTVLRIDLKDPVPADGEVQLRIGFVSKLPRGIGRTGWVQDYYFAAQWFPKLGVFRDGKWNCHQYHRNTEYYADFGTYRVTVTTPAGFIVGASGEEVGRSEDGKLVSYSFAGDRIHDFAWVASPRFLEHTEDFEQNEGPRVRIRLLLLPEHQSFADRYLEAARHTLHYMGEWFGPYPYDHLTVVDPALNSTSGGMEYPALATGGTHFLSPRESLSPEEVTIHEVGHQWWYGVVANNEFEEAWLDEGINTWATARVMRAAYPKSHYRETFFGGLPLLFSCTPVPYETALDGASSSLADVRGSGRKARMVEPSWTLLDAQSYVTNSYSKPALTLFTLERLLGEEVLRKALSTYYRRYSFSHATTADLIRTIEESSGQDLGWFFEQTFYSSELLDYAVAEVRSFSVEPKGILTDSVWYSDELFRSEVVVERRGAARFPVEIRVRFSDGTSRVEEWDGQDSRVRFQYTGPERVELAVVDPQRKLLLDIDPVNNSRYDQELVQAGFSRASKKWTLKWMFWLQNLLETFAFLG